MQHGFSSKSILLIISQLSRSLVLALCCGVLLTGCLGIEELEQENIKLKKEVRTLKKDIRKSAKAVKKLTKQSAMYQSQASLLSEDLEKISTETKKYKKVATEAESVTLEKDKLIAALEKKVASAKKATKKKKKIYAKLHYWRADRDYYNWGVHAKGLAIQRSTAWSDPIRFKYLSDFGAYAKVELHKDHKKHPLKFLVHSGAETDLISDEQRQVEGLNRQLMEADVSEVKELYLVSGIAKIFTIKSDAIAAREKLLKAE